MIRNRIASGAAAAVLAAALCLGWAAPAEAYFNRGAVSVEVEASELQVHAGEQASASLALTPASDTQLEGCGMPSCPQSCSDSCMDENGQCGCAGKEASEYTPAVVATSSDPSVAVAVADGSSLTVYAKKAGDATITVRASLRQFTDGTDTVEVHVTGRAEDAAGSANAYVEIPAAAEAANVEAEELEVVEKTVMGRTIRYVKLNGAADAAECLREMAGVDGDLTFWMGDTYYQPDWSITFTGTDYAEEDVDEVDAALSTSREASGTLTEPLDGLEGFEIVSLAQSGAFPAAARVYVRADDLFAEDAAVALYAYDSTSRSFTEVEGSDAQMAGAYALFTVSEGGEYVLSADSLAAASAGESGDVAADSAEAAADADEPADEQGAPWAVPAAIAIIVAAAAVFVLVRRRSRTGGE